MLETKASPSVQFLLVQNSGQGWQLALWISDRTQNKTGTFSSRQGPHWKKKTWLVISTSANIMFSKKITWEEKTNASGLKTFRNMNDW